MIAPALVYLACAGTGEGQRGWGIPMATDIAFVVGCMAILGPRVPHGLRIMMLTLAVADDMGAIVVIVLGYSQGLDVNWLVGGIAGILAVSALSRLGVRNPLAYVLLGIVVWYAFLESGIHATLAGVILGLMTPARAHLSETAFAHALRRAEQVFEGGEFASLPHRGEKVRQFQHMARETISPLEYLETTLHPWSSFVVMPIFALANAGVPFDASRLSSPIALAAMLGLVLGKPIGIVTASWIVVKAKLATLPDGVNWKVMIGAGCLGGIGFTMALFIAELALAGKHELLDTAKMGVLLGSALSAVLGMGLLAWLLPKAGPDESLKH
jgi:NhaA family Na+:H+ antiporter